MVFRDQQSQKREIQEIFLQRNQSCFKFIFTYSYTFQTADFPEMILMKVIEKTIVLFYIIFGKNKATN